ncbi:shikimate kinase [Streptomyces sp. SAJ15]|uniref:shikimate kinase n=1 Tax=Streptomyces sp. SAJ15 TaxID=2011095 RepID=UPI0021B2C213|nr:shikimate kinase [Streptomyces sp. SAJ15]
MDGTDEVRSLPDWRVLVVGGASGMGKTSVGRALARRYDVPVVEVDDIVEALLAVTLPEHLPEVHFWRTHPEAARQTPESVVERQIAIAEALAPAIEAVVANHVGTDTPVILEGDYVLPRPATPKGPVRAVFLHEDDEGQVTANYLRREPEAGPQPHRARVSVLYGRWLAAQARAAGVPVVAPRPWEGLAGRVAETVEDASTETVASTRTTATQSLPRSPAAR